MIPVFVKPSEGARVRQPDRGSTVMPVEGGWVPRNVYYESLIQSGDVIVVNPQPEMPKQEPEPAERPSPLPGGKTEPDLSRPSRPPPPDTDQFGRKDKPARS